MRIIKKITLIVLCITMLAFLAGCDHYSTTKSSTYQYSLGEIAEVIYYDNNDEPTPEFVFRIESVTYEETDSYSDYYGIYTIDYDHTSYRSDFNFEMRDIDENNFTILDHDKKKKTLTIAQTSEYARKNLYFDVLCPSYITDGNYDTLDLSFEIDLNDDTVYDDPTLEDHFEKLEKKYQKMKEDKEKARLKEARINSAISFAMSFIIIAFIVLIITFTSKRLRNKIRTRREEVADINVLSPDFKKYRPCAATRGLGIFSFILSLLVFLPSALVIALAEEAVFLPTFICLIAFTAGLASCILRNKLYEKHGLDIAGITISLFPLMIAILPLL